jgi:ABC-type antimicrobial peptide transport system permease subunit
MTALLLAGAAIAALLAILGGIIQAVVSVRQRTVQFAVLRTLGTSRRQLARVVLVEQLALYAFGLLAGTLFGLVLASATLPYLQFSIGLTDTTGAGGPPYILVVDPARVLALYAGLLLAFLLALLLQRLVLARLALGRLLRIGED